MKTKKTKKTVLVISLVLTFIFSLLMSNFTNSPALAAEQIVLSVAPSTANPPPALGLTLLIEDMFGLLEKRTNGKLKFEIYWGQSLAKGRDCVTAVQTGIADIARLTPSYEPGKIPLSAVSHQPGIGTHMWPRMRAYWDMVNEDPIKSELSEFNLHPIALTPVTDTGMITNIPIKTVADIEGKKFAGGGMVGETIKMLGGVPIHMGPGEEYDMLKKGTINGISAPYAAINDFKFYEPGKYFTNWHFGSRQGPVVINGDVYRNLPANIQKVIDNSALLMIRIAYEDFSFTDNLAIDAMKQDGIEFFDPNPAAAAKVKEIQAGMADKWAEELESKGLPAKKVLARYTELVEKYEKVNCFYK